MKNLFILAGIVAALYYLFSNEHRPFNAAITPEPGGPKWLKNPTYTKRDQPDPAYMKHLPNGRVLDTSTGYEYLVSSGAAGGFFYFRVK